MFRESDRAEIDDLETVIKEIKNEYPNLNFKNIGIFGSGIGLVSYHVLLFHNFNILEA